MTDTTTVKIVRDDEGVKITEYNATEAALAKLDKEYKGMVFDVTTTKGMAEAKEARKRLRGLRTGLEAKRRDLKAPVLDYTRALDGQAKAITARIEALETPIDQHIKAEEARKAREKAEAEAAERNRLEANRKIIETLRNRPLDMIGAKAADIWDAFQAAQGFDLDTLDEDFRTEASLLKDEAAGKLHELWTRAKHAEEAQAREEAAEAKARQEREAKEAEEKAKRDAELAELEELRRFKAQREAEEEAAKAAQEEDAKRAQEAEARSHGVGTATLRQPEEDEKNRQARDAVDQVRTDIAQASRVPPELIGIDHGAGLDKTVTQVFDDAVATGTGAMRVNREAEQDFIRARDSLVKAMEGALTMEQAEQIIDEIIGGNITYVAYIGTPSLEQPS